jgi:DNA replication protein DnaC
MASTTMSRPQPPEPSLAELSRLAEELDLTALRAALPGLLAQAEQDGPSYTDFALTLMRAEIGVRRERQLARGLKCSRLGSVEGIDHFDFAARPQLEARVVKELLNCRFVEEKRNVICVGPPGRGKTRVAKALAHAACLRGHRTLFTITAEMLEELHGSLADGTFKRALRRYAKPAVLVLDEFGNEPFDRKMASYLFRLVSARHGVGTTIVTAQTGFSKWTSFFPSEAEAIATVDRLVDRATILRFTGKSFRNPQDIHGAPLE